MKRIIKNLAIIGSITVFLLLGILWYLNIYTNHDSELVEVIDVEGKSALEASRLLREKGLEAVVIDTVYKDGVKKNGVINQNPNVGQYVKEGRKVYLIINTSKVPMVAVPDLAGKTSLPDAQNILYRRHLKVGKIIKEMTSSVRTRSDEPVLAQYYSGTTDVIEANTLIERNSAIDLVVGVSTDYFDAMDSTQRAAESQDL